MFFVIQGMAELMLDATQNHEVELTEVRLYQWHKYLFPSVDEKEFSFSNDINVGGLRGDEPMQAVSGSNQ